MTFQDKICGPEWLLLLSHEAGDKETLVAALRTLACQRDRLNGPLADAVTGFLMRDDLIRDEAIREFARSVNWDAPGPNEDLSWIDGEDQ